MFFHGKIASKEQEISMDLKIRVWRRWEEMRAYRLEIEKKIRCKDQ